MSYDLHPLCTLFPRVTGAEFDVLTADIRANGLREPITVHQGLILDGGNRYRACLEAGIEPRFTEFSGGNLVSFVLSANLHRRHLTASQQAAIVASAQDWARAQSHGGDRASAPESTCSDTTATRAAQSGASVSTQRRADAVAKADPELAKKVALGEVSLPRAVEQVAPQLASKPKAKPDALPAPVATDEPPAYEVSDEEIAEAEAHHTQTLALFERAMATDDPLGTALKENALLAAENESLRSRLFGLMNEKNEAVRLANGLRKRLEKLERASA